MVITTTDMLSASRIDGPWIGTHIMQNPYFRPFTISVPLHPHTISEPYDNVSTLSCLLLCHFTGIPFTKATIPIRVDV